MDSIRSRTSSRVVAMSFCAAAFAQTEVKTLAGLAAGDSFGWSVANVGVVDGDAIDDFAVGAPYSDVNGTDSGQVLVCSGRTTG
ncbi:MAG: hypothetical protein HZA52_11875 [Planctomycetes bacterium]|nr:hypothetical protein [Planctomycetota bacterium]